MEQVISASGTAINPIARTPSDIRSWRNDRSVHSVSAAIGRRFAKAVLAHRRTMLLTMPRPTSLAIASI
ncbi:hypothetical protein IFO70_26540 [Phormidium tenue FACHB-886]|nr:hypothetical protein [Phormidium tenue FACHB-886]